MKGAIQAGAAYTSQYLLRFSDGPEIYIPRVGEVAIELVVAERPDKTMGSTGQRGTVETDFDVPAHHQADVSYCERKLREAEAGAPGHKVQAVFAQLGPGNTVVRSWAWRGVLFRSRSIPEHSAGEDGTMAVLTYGITIDDVVPL